MSSIADCRTPTTRMEVRSKAGTLVGVTECVKFIMLSQQEGGFKGAKELLKIFFAPAEKVAKIPARPPPQCSHVLNDQVTRRVATGLGTAHTQTVQEIDAVSISRDDDSMDSNCSTCREAAAAKGEPKRVTKLLEHLDLNTEQCSVNEKVERWKESLQQRKSTSSSCKSKDKKLHQCQPHPPVLKKTDRKESSRDSLDSGHNSTISVETSEIASQRDSLSVLLIQHHSLISPMSAGDDTVMSSMMSSLPSDVSDEEEELAKTRAKRRNSQSSWSSVDGDDCAEAADAMESVICSFMKQFVHKVFYDYEGISQQEKSKLGEYARHPAGRLWFSKSVNSQRVHQQRVEEGTFYSLVQYLAVVLFECFEANDWSPAKVLMNMCFTFYTQVGDSDHDHREHLYNCLANQPIWKSLRFWNAAFFDAILCERAKFNIPVTKGNITTVPDRESQRQCLENITFGQLATFTHNMHAFGLPQKLCLEFLEKQVTIANLPQPQIELLQENMERLFKQASK